MAAKGRARVRRSESEWQAILRRASGSGQSQASFCRGQEISPSTFQVWRRRLRSQIAAREFVDVTPAAAPAPSILWSIEIEFPDGTTARVRG
jgi:transposase-like protein